jgi:hypothetical protein
MNDGGDASSGAADSSPPRRDDAGAPLARFITKVVSFMPGDCAGFGAESLPDIVFGPPWGAGDRMGSLDVVSLGQGGTIVVGFEPSAIADGPGADFIVFENAFWIGGDSTQPFVELAEVSVSDDGATWKTFPCTAIANPYGACSGWKPVYSNSQNGISPFDPSKAGGEAYDLADVGMTRAKFVRIRDMGQTTCPADPSKKLPNLGYDLDAIAVINPL